jgi:hypothetical protein
MKTKLTILQFIAKHGEEKTAFKLLDKHIISLYGLSILDLPDTCNPEKREHSFSLTYAKKAVNEAEKNFETAKKLWL